MTHIFRLGHSLFRKLDRPVIVDRRSISAGFDLRSESGRVVRIDNVTRARTPGGRYVLIAPNGAVVDHEEHGLLTLPSGVFATDAVRDARPDEVRTRTMQISEDVQRALRAEQID
jgi:hypothetical protein